MNSFLDKMIGPTKAAEVRTHQAKMLGNMSQRDETTGVTEKYSEDDIKNLYYLDEMIKDMYNNGVMLNGGFKYSTFLVDWYSELYKKVGHTDAERQQYLKKNFDFDKGWIEENFMTPEERDLFLEHKL